MTFYNTTSILTSVILHERLQGRANKAANNLGIWS